MIRVTVRRSQCQPRALKNTHEKQTRTSITTKALFKAGIWAARKSTLLVIDECGNCGFEEHFSSLALLAV
jgi:hypothetical protein